MTTLLVNGRIRKDGSIIRKRDTALYDISERFSLITRFSGVYGEQAEVTVPFWASVSVDDVCAALEAAHLTVTREV